jgi:hypothetical protein
VLYESVARAPQLQSVGLWRAPPILVSGASAYRDGEYLYQDFLYDDHGARAQPDPTDPRARPGLSQPVDALSQPDGTYTYPTGPGYNGDAADLVEFRVRPLMNATAFRLTLNTLIDPSLVGATIVIGNSRVPVPLPHGANARAPARMFVTWHGRTADLLDAGGRAVGSRSLRVTVDSVRRQIQILVPHADWNPASSTVRVAVGVGLWDAAGDRYLIPQTVADATHPGGAGGLARPAAFFNLGFRHREPLPRFEISGLTDPAWWRDKEQAHALANGDLTPFHDDVNFAKLRRRVNDDMAGAGQGVPRNGPMDRILASHTETGQGLDFSILCAPPLTSCPGEYRGQLEPYAVYVPARRPRFQRYQLTLLLHSYSGNYNQFLGSRNQRQFGERPDPSLVITPEERGPDGFYEGAAAADTFETWADVAARWRLDPDRTTIAGYSVGGVGAFLLAAQFPDLFAKAQPTVGVGIGASQQLASLRWVPLLMWNATADGAFESWAQELFALGYRLELDEFADWTPPLALPFGGLTPDHLQLALDDQFAPAARFLDDARVLRNPPRVTYVFDPPLDTPQLGAYDGHAYWLSGIRPRSYLPQAPLPTIDVRSEGFGVGDPQPTGVRIAHGALTGGALGTRSYTSQLQTWTGAPRRPRRNRLDITATNVAVVTIDARRARVTCSGRLSVHSDGPLSVRLVDCRGRLLK